ncbi:MAG: carbonic anhydrase [candidate division KSB1 bacterium]|nr:carbonic anhydrase [candidate division KSB1 bacterium]MDZ7304345.1 carbonic anhydrase [candidate division KSB1 bacterium]MDZ7313658.1 carbonic anhydrase [candidate division KSB1 bacterium]
MNGLIGDQALKELMIGNQRYVATQLTHPHQTAMRRAEVAKGQRPFAIILGCSDSRVPPEIIFDQGLGDLFVIRVAGNILDEVVVGSIEYAAKHLGVHLIVVLGHKRCGAVEATVKGGEAPSQIKRVIAALKPAVEKVRGLSGDLVENVVKANIEMVVDCLKSSQPILAKLVEDGKLKIVGGYYDLDTGTVNIIS